VVRYKARQNPNIISLSISLFILYQPSSK